MWFSDMLHLVGSERLPFGCFSCSVADNYDLRYDRILNIDRNINWRVPRIKVIKKGRNEYKISTNGRRWLSAQRFQAKKVVLMCLIDIWR